MVRGPIRIINQKNYSENVGQLKSAPVLIAVEFHGQKWIDRRRIPDLN